MTAKRTCRTRKVSYAQPWAKVKTDMLDLYTNPLPNKTVFYLLGADIVPLKMCALDSQLLVITAIISFSFPKAFSMIRQTSLSPSPYLGLRNKGPECCLLWTSEVEAKKGISATLSVIVLHPLSCLFTLVWKG